MLVLFETVDFLDAVGPLRVGLEVECNLVDVLRFRRHLDPLHRSFHCHLAAFRSAAALAPGPVAAFLIYPERVVRRDW